MTQRACSASRFASSHLQLFWLSVFAVAFLAFLAMAVSLLAATASMYNEFLNKDDAKALRTASRDMAHDPRSMAARLLEMTQRANYMQYMTSTEETPSLTHI